jgi:hypothetical protein
MSCTTCANTKRDWPDLPVEQFGYPVTAELRARRRINEECDSDCLDWDQAPHGRFMEASPGRPTRSRRTRSPAVLARLRADPLEVPGQVVGEVSTVARVRAPTAIPVPPGTRAQPAMPVCRARPPTLNQTEANATLRHSGPSRNGGTSRSTITPK